MLFSKASFVTMLILASLAAPHAAQTPSPTSLELTPFPTPEPTPSPSPEPTPRPSPEPTPEPTPALTPEPTPAPTSVPTPETTQGPTPEPTPAPTPDPTPEPTAEPTPEPSTAPTTPDPTSATTPGPTPAPTPVSTEATTPEPTPAPTPEFTPAPTPVPTTFRPYTPPSTTRPSFRSPTPAPTTFSHYTVPTVAPNVYTATSSAPATRRPARFCASSLPTPPSVCRGVPNWKLLLVFGVDGPFCAEGPSYCSSSITDSCPGPQAGLPYGSYCAKLPTGRFGCLPHSSCDDGTTFEDGEMDPADDQDAPTPADDAPSDPVYDETSGCLLDTKVPDLEACSDDQLLKGGWAPISVQGRYHFCTRVTPQLPKFCVADIVGNCPTAQPGLPYGSECRFLTKTKVYGCVPRTTCAENDPPTTPAPSSAAPSTTASTGCVLTSSD